MTLVDNFTGLPLRDSLDRVVVFDNLDHCRRIQATYRRLGRLYNAVSTNTNSKEQ